MDLTLDARFLSSIHVNSSRSMEEGTEKETKIRSDKRISKIEDSKLKETRAVPTQAQRTLIQILRDRGTRIWFMPAHFERANCNKTRYDKQKKQILWTVEVLGQVLHDISENVKLLDLVSEEQRQGCSSDYSILYESRSNHNQPGHASKDGGSFIAIDDWTKTLRQALSGVSIIEYPRIVKTSFSHELGLGQPEEEDEEEGDSELLNDDSLLLLDDEDEDDRDDPSSSEEDGELCSCE